MRRVLLGCLMAVACVMEAAAAEPDLTKEFAVIGKALTEGRCDVPRIRKFLDRADFQNLTGTARSLAYSALGVCDRSGLHEAVLKATAEPDAASLAWSLRFLDAAERKDMPDALRSIRAAVDRKSDGTLTFFSDDLVYQVARELRDDATGFRAYAAELDRADWKTSDPHYRGDFVWARYAGLLADAGDRTHAWRVASRVTEPGELLRMSLDKRYDAIVAVDPERFDIPASAEAELMRAQDLLARNPRDGTAVSHVLGLLRMLGRQQAALDLVDKTLAIEGAVLSYRGDDHRNWLLNDRALVLLELGRFDDAVAAMENAANLSERGGPNVSQTINLAGFQVATGRFEAALKTLASGEQSMQANVTPYGRMWIAAERACAYQGLGRKDEAARAVAATAAQAKDNHGAHAKALLCVGDLDGAAAAYKARLADAGTRAAALTQLSRFLQPPLTPFDAEMHRRLETLRSRADIQAAVAEVGRTRDFQIQSGSLVDGY